jgi:hypothetical protein
MRVDDIVLERPEFGDRLFIHNSSLMLLNL